MTGLVLPAGLSHAGGAAPDRSDDAAVAAKRRMQTTRRTAVVMPQVANATRAFGPDACVVPTTDVPADPAAATVPPEPCVPEPATTAPTTTAPPATTVPTTDTTVPTTDTSLPADTTTSVPTDPTTTVPPPDTTTPDTTLPPTGTTAPPTDTTVPPVDTTLPPTTVPPTDPTTTVPPPDTTLPPTTVPPTDPATTVPPPDTTLPPTTVPPTDPAPTTTIPLPAPEPEPAPAPTPEPPAGVEAPIHDSSRPPLIIVDPSRQPEAGSAIIVLPEPAVIVPDEAALPDPAVAPDPAATPTAETQPPTDATVPPAPDSTAPAVPAEAPTAPADDHSHDDAHDGHDHSTDTRVGPRAPLPTTGVVADGVPVAVVLETIRTFESNSRYDAAPNAASASGAYQYIPSTWAGYGGYAEAYLAPPEVQDARAAADVEAVLATYGDVSMVPIAWYFPLASTDPSWMDRVPNPAGGNTLTVRQYQSKWLDVYVEKLTAYAPVPSLPDSRAGDVRSIAFPVLGPVAYSNDWGACRDDCTRHHEGNDIIGVRMQPLLAVTDGVVSRVRFENAGKAGAIITVTDADGWSYNYFHVNNDTPGSDDGAAGPEWQVSPYISVGSHVSAGQIIGYMGDSGNSEGSVPHLHFEIRRPDGTPVNPHPSLIAAQQRQQCSIGIGPWSTNVSADADPAAPGVTIAPLFGEGAWYIDAAGRVTATGDAALIRPGRTNPCPPGPSTPFGTGGGAAAVPPGDLPAVPVETPAEPTVEPDPAAVEVTDPTTGSVQVVTTLPPPANEPALGVEVGRGSRAGFAESTKR